MQLKNSLSFLIMLCFLTGLYGQVGIGTTTPSEASMLEVSSQSESNGPYRGFMPPRVPDETARDAINPSEEDIGLIVFVISTRCLEVWNGLSWQNLKCFSTGPQWPAIQNFDTTPASFELPLYEVQNGDYTTGLGDYPNSPLYVSPDRGYGVSNKTATVTLGPIDVSMATSATFKLRLAAFSETSTNGLDDSDTVSISIGVNGPSGSFSEELKIKGGDTPSSNNKWDFGATGNASVAYDGDNSATEFTSGAGDSGGISYLEITGIPNATDLVVKIKMKNNKTKELWVIDDAEIWGN